MINIEKSLKITLLGLGLSTSSLAVLLKKLDFADVFISELKKEKHNEFFKKIKNLGYEYEFGFHSDRVFLSRDLIIASPGFPPNSKIMKEIRCRNIPVISDIEFIYRLFPEKKYIAITGSNGKSTTTSLIYHILSKSGINSEIGGNIGIPISDIILKNPSVEYIVLETSSYQLELTRDFSPHISVFLNISPNHLSHHGDMESYIKAKTNIFKNQTSNDFLIIPSDHIFLDNYLLKYKGNLLTFGFDDTSNIKCSGKTLYFNNEKLFKLDKIKLFGDHNMQNIMCATITSLLLGINAKDIKESIESFNPLEHRFEYVCTINGIKIVNDSKSTTVVSLLMALKSFKEDKKIILLAGGTDKNTPLDPLKDISKKKIKHAVLYGKAGERFYSFFSKIVESTLENGLRNAFEKALELSEKGDCILLSPACASFDEFKNFEERGKYFKKLALSKIQG